MTWQIEVNVSRETLRFFTPLLEANFCSVASLEINDGKAWRLQGWSEEKPNIGQLKTQIALMSAMLGISEPHVTVNRVAEKNWLEENKQSFPPLEIGNFYLYGSHIKSDPPKDKISFEIDAGLAFGTGSHPTTAGCLKTLEFLSKEIKAPVDCALDLGCGSGILAFAISKLWGCPITGIDNDPDAILVAKDNAQKNHVPEIEWLVSEGFNQLPATQGFDLITANILANPLCDLTPDMARYMNSDGYIVLSGILNTQAERVIQAYKKVGFSLFNEMVLKEWVTLTMRHNG